MDELFYVYNFVPVMYILTGPKSMTKIDVSYVLWNSSISSMFINKDSFASGVS